MSTPNLSLVQMFRCGAWHGGVMCGRRARPVDFVCKTDNEVTTLTICKKCQKRHHKAIKKTRPVWKRMRKIGVPAEIASEVMGFLLDRWPDPDTPTTEAPTDDAG